MPRIDRNHFSRGWGINRIGAVINSDLTAPIMLHGYIPPHRFLPYLSWVDIDALPDRRNTVIVLPCGAIEQHGPHLPCSVDSVIASGVMGRALDKLPSSVAAFAMPTITYGKSEEHLHFPGTMTLTGTTLLSTVIEIGESVYRSGFRKLVFANGHGGQPQVLEMAARELRLRHGDFVVVPFGVTRLPNASSKQIGDQEKRLSMHAGHSETALMLALSPETVRMDRAAASFPPPFPVKLLSPDGRPACAWTARDFGPSGVIGDPTSATLEQGQEILETLSDSWAQALTELHALDWIVREEPTWERGHQTGFIQTFSPAAA